MNHPIKPPISHIVEELFLYILSGPEKGETFKVSGSVIRIGRGKDNDICIQKDSRLSRHHLKILIKGAEIYIESLNEKNPVWINKKSFQTAIIEYHVLRNGFKFTAGKTEFELKSKVLREGSLSAKKDPTSLASPLISPQSKKTRLRLGIYVVVGLLLALLILSDKNKEDEEEKSGLLTEKDMKEKITDRSKFLNDLRNKDLKSGKLTQKFERAQTEYIKGFRDYRQGQYERALQYFNGCISIDPSHELCKRYSNLTRKRVNEIIQHYMVTGKKSLDKKHYQSCMTSFKNVMVMVGDPRDIVYREAKINYDICRHHNKRRF